ncbi:antitoxin [Paracoccus marinus]|nr:antitoxin [Paracoccus marinus]
MEAAVAQIVVRQIPDEVHRALKAQAAAHGRSAEAELREIIARAVLREGRPRAGDLMRGIWSGAETSVLTLERDPTPVEPARFE